MQLIFKCQYQFCSEMSGFLKMFFICFLWHIVDILLVKTCIPEAFTSFLRCRKNFAWIVQYLLTFCAALFFFLLYIKVFFHNNASVICLTDDVLFFYATTKS